MIPGSRYVLVLPWFGSVPKWWAYFEQGMIANPDVTFVIFSDCLQLRSLPRHVSVRPMTLEGVRKLAERKLQTTVSLTRPMKLCDLRPMYGHIFEDYLRGCEFWGFGDTDVVYGNLGKWLSRARDANADIISFRRLWLSGSLCFVRNNDVLCHLYKNSPAWEGVVADSRNLLFDELGGIFYGERSAGVPVQELPARHGSFTLLVDNAERNGELRVSALGPICETLSFNGLLRRTPEGMYDLKKGCELAYYHLVIDKRRFFKCDSGQEPPETYFISPTGFWSEQEYGSPSQRLLAARRIVSGLAACGGRRGAKWLHRIAGRLFSSRRSSP
jgi:hypothetical protein